MAGIERIVIEDEIAGQGAWRFRQAKVLWPAANDLYREIFSSVGCPLADGYREVTCSRDDIEAAYDRLLGIDVIFTYANGMRSTLQEKFLSQAYNTVTVEYFNNPANGEEGDWHHLKAQYYFVGYDRTKSLSFQDWVMLDWSAVQRETLKGNIKWSVNSNRRDGARANFKVGHIEGFPLSCVIAKEWGGVSNGGKSELRHVVQHAMLDFDLLEIAARDAPYYD